MVVIPSPRIIAVRERRCHDHPAFQPHTQIEQNGYCEHHRDTGLPARHHHGERNYRAAEDHRPPERCVRASRLLHQHFLGHLIVAVPYRSELDAVQVSPHHSNRKGQAHGLLQDRHGHVFLELEHITQNNEQRDNRRTTGIQRARHEVRRERSHVPARLLRHGKVGSHDGVHRYRQRNQETRHRQIGHAEVAPLPVGAFPTQR